MAFLGEIRAPGSNGHCANQEFWGKGKGFIVAERISRIRAVGRQTFNILSIDNPTSHKPASRVLGVIGCVSGSELAGHRD